MINSDKLIELINETNVWQASIDFGVSGDSNTKFKFKEKYDDFYLSLMSTGYKLLSIEYEENVNNDLIQVAKGLEIFSLQVKKDYFDSISSTFNAIFASSLYYIADRESSSYILSKTYKVEEYTYEVERFLVAVFTKNLSIKNEYVEILKDYLYSGKIEIIKNLYSILVKKREESFFENIDLYFGYFLAEKVINKLSKNNIWIDLLSVNSSVSYWEKYVHNNLEKQHPIWCFFPSQREALKNGILSNNTCTLEMPTSAGKSSLCELIIYNEFQKDRNCKILYLAPFRSLATELKSELRKNLVRIGVKVKVEYGGNLPTEEDLSNIEDANLLISTPEKFNALQSTETNLIQDFNTIICDEGHILDDLERGLEYELMIAKLRSYKIKKFVFISAILPNLSEINQWLGGSHVTHLKSEYKSTEVDYCFLMKENQNYKLRVFTKMGLNKGRYELPNILNLKNKPNSKKKISNKFLAVATSLKAIYSGTVALFALNKLGNQGVVSLAEEILKQLNDADYNAIVKEDSMESIKEIHEYFKIHFGENYILTRSIIKGVLFHHGDLPQDTREIVERTIRENKVRIFVCNTTLSEGVNLPIKTLVIYSIRNRIDNHENTLYLRDLKNLIGRVARPGKEQKGYVVFIDSKDLDVFNNISQDKGIEKVIGFFKNYILKTQSQRNITKLNIIKENFQNELDNLLINLIEKDNDSENYNFENSEIVLYEKLYKYILGTFSYFIANIEDKNKIIDEFNKSFNRIKIISTKVPFSILKQTGIEIQFYNEIIETFDFSHIIWESEFNPLDPKWIEFLITNGIFKITSCKYSEWCKFKSDQFKEISEDILIKIITSWIVGKWYGDISNELKDDAPILIDVSKLLYIFKKYIQEILHSFITKIIKLREILKPDLTLPNQILNWPDYLQYGVNSQLQLDLIRLGLNDRIVVVVFSKILEESSYIHFDKEKLYSYIRWNKVKFLKDIKNKLPVISYEKFVKFLN